MNIYPDELDIADKIKAGMSIAYTIPVSKEPSFINKAVASTIQNLAVASTMDRDLYRTKSVLVSTNWNKNDDIFSSAEVWKARYTPTHKPTNLEHDEKQIVGHITNTWAIANDGTIIPDDTPVEELPSLFHIVNGAVIYMLWEDEELKTRAQELVESIENGEKFVSMECFFGDFDYGIIDGDDFKVVARNKETAWLSKRLKIYGGDGVYENKRLGRFLKNITFCGKGYVNKPANSYSIIFDSEEVLNFSKASHYTSLDFSNNGVLLDDSKSKGENLMSDVNTKLEEQVKALQSKLDEATEKLAKANTEQLQAKIDALTAEVTEAKQTATDKDAQLTAKVAELEQVKAKVTELEDTNKKLVEEITVVKAAELETKRISKLVDGGISKDVAEAKVKIFASLTDEQFDVVATELVEAAKAKVVKTETTKEAEVNEDDVETDPEGETAASEAKVEVNAEETITLASTGGNTDTRDELRKELASLLVNRKNKKDKE